MVPEDTGHGTEARGRAGVRPGPEALGVARRPGWLLTLASTRSLLVSQAKHPAEASNKYTAFKDIIILFVWYYLFT